MNNNPVVLYGPTARHILSLGETIPVDFQRFPGGESYCQIRENIRGRDVFALQSICAPANDSLMDLLVLGDAARRASAGRLTAVIPYMGYMRQDRKDKPRVPISAKLVVDMLECAGFQRIITIDVHTLQAQGFTNVPFDHLFGFPLLTRAITRAVPDSPLVFLSPDIGGVKRIQAYAGAFGADFAIVNKKRLDANSVQACSIIGDVDGLDVVVVDDLTESCNTLISAATIARQHGAKSVSAVVTHACLHQRGLANLRQAFDNGTINFFITTNTVHSPGLEQLMGEGHPVVIEDCSQFLWDVINRTSEGRSLTELFDLEGF